MVEPETQPVYIKAGDPLMLTCEQDEGIEVKWLKGTEEVDTSATGFFTTNAVEMPGGKVCIILLQK